MEEEFTVKDFLSPSQSKKFVCYKLDDWNNTEIMKKFSKFKPTEILQIGPLTFNVVFRDDIEYDMIWEELYTYVVAFTDYVCQNTPDTFGTRPSKTYIGKNYENKANLIILCSIHNEPIYKEFGIDALIGFFLCDYDLKQKAHIIATCYHETKGAGLLLRCIGLSILKNLKFKDVYTEAINRKLIEYYNQLGFRLGKKLCGEKDKVLDMYGKHDLDEIMIALEEGITTSEYMSAWPMKWCDFDEKKICETAIDQVKKMKATDVRSGLLLELPKKNEKPKK
jgi:hypothetical protein